MNPEHLENTSTSQINEIDRINLEAEKISRSDPARMLELSLEARKLASGSGYTRGLAQALCNIGVAYWRMSNYTEALSHSRQALSYFEQLKDHERKMRLLLNIGLVHQSETQYDKALQHFFESLEICENLGDNSGKSIVLANIGAIYHNLSRYEKAMEYFLPALSLAEESGNRQRIAGILANIARTYLALSQFDLALEYQVKSLEIYRQVQDKVGESRTLLNMGLNYERRKDYNTTLDYYYKALVKFEEIHDKAYQAATLLNIGGVYREIQEYDLALEYLLKAFKIADEIGDMRSFAIALANIGNTYLRIGNVDEAIVALETALEAAHKVGMLFNEAEIYRDLSGVYEQLGETAKALEYYKKFSDLREMLQSQDVQRSIAEMQIRFEVEKAEKEKEIYRLRNVELASALAQVEALNTHLLELDNEKNEFLGIVAHDLKNPLAGIMMSVSLLQSYHQKMSAEDKAKHLGSIETSVKRMTNIITNLLDINAIESGKLKLHPEKLSVSAIVDDIIESYKDRACVKNIDIHTEYLSDDDMIFADRIAVTESLENLVSNAVKYSPLGKNVFIRISREDQKLRCDIQDEGPGLSEQDKEKLFAKFARLSAKPTGGEDSTGLGLSIVKKLMDMLGGRVYCQSEQGHGATFTVEFPLT